MGPVDRQLALRTAGHSLKSKGKLWILSYFCVILALRIMQRVDLIFKIFCDSKIIWKRSKVCIFVPLPISPPFSLPSFSFQNVQRRFMTLGLYMKGCRNRKTGSSRSTRSSSNSVSFRKHRIQGTPRGLFDARWPHATLFLTSHGIVLIILVSKCSLGGKETNFCLLATLNIFV